MDLEEHKFRTSNAQFLTCAKADFHVDPISGFLYDKDITKNLKERGE